MKCLYKTLSDLFIINCLLLSTVPSARVYDMIHNLDISVGSIPLGMLASAVDTDEGIYLTWSGPGIPSI